MQPKENFMFMGPCITILCQ